MPPNTNRNVTQAVQLGRLIAYLCLSLENDLPLFLDVLKEEISLLRIHLPKLSVGLRV